MMLSVLICSLHKRADKLQDLLRQLGTHPDCEILVEIDNGEMTTGAKRNLLVSKAHGRHIVFIDDDDRPAATYLHDMCEALECDPDCIGFKGWYLHRGKSTEWIISRSLPYKDAIIDNKKVYLRHTNHLAPVRREIALRAGFPDKTYQEDYEYSLRLLPLLKTEVFINKHLYWYIK